MNKKLVGTVVILMSLGTFVPTAFAATTHASAHSQFKSSIVLDGQVVSSPYGVASSDGSTVTTYMPLYYLDQSLGKAGFSATWDGQTHTWALTSLQDNIDFSAIPVGTGNTSITVNGQLVKKINVIAQKDPAGGKKAVPTTYAPIYYLEQLIEAIGVQSKWDGSAHKWTAVSPKVLRTGTLGPNSGQQTVNSDVYVKDDGVTLQNLNVNGTVYLDPGANGSVTLNHVTVSGKIVVLSGANHSIHFDNVTANNVEYHSSSPVNTDVTNSTLGTITITDATGTNKVTINVTSGTVVNVVDSASTPVVLQGQGYQVLTVGANSNIDIGGSVSTVNITVPNAIVNIDSSATVSNLNVSATAGGASITNNGTISNLTNNSSTSVSVAGTGSVTSSTGSVNNTTTGTTGSTQPSTGGGGGSSVDPQTQAINELTADLQNIYGKLDSSGVQALNQAETNASGISWNGYVYPGQTSLNAQQQNAVKAIQDLVELSSYGAITGNNASSSVTTLLSDFDKVDSNVQATDLHSFFLNFKNAIVGQIPGMLDGTTSKTAAVTSALNTAVSGDSNLNGFLYSAGLSVSDLDSTWKAVNPTIDPNHSALDALLSAAALASSGGLIN